MNQMNQESIRLPQGFSVGYARRDITPVGFPVVLTETTSLAESAHDPMQITCTALSDGKNVALILSVDLINMELDLNEISKKLLCEGLGFEIPSENIFLNCTHSHTVINYKKKTDPGVIAWKEQVYYKQLPPLAEEALRDLTPAKAYVGKSHTEGLTFVRRYFREDGTFSGILVKSRSTAPIVRHETDADTEMRTLRFVRRGKKDVLLVNYQTHHGSAGALYPRQISADWVHEFRKAAEKELNCHFAYHNGAAGNLNFYSSVKGERKYPTFLDAIPYIIGVTKSAIASETEAAVGEIRVAHTNYAGTCNNTYPKETVALAKAIVDAPYGSEEQKALVESSDFYDAFHAQCVYNAANMGSVNVPLTAITCGDLAFCAFPYEMFDTN